jgi:hypothetical protein
MRRREKKKTAESASTPVDTATSFAGTLQTLVCPVSKGQCPSQLPKVAESQLATCRRLSSLQPRVGMYPLSVPVTTSHEAGYRCHLAPSVALARS